MDAHTIYVTGRVQRTTARRRAGDGAASHFEEADRIRAAFDAGEFAIDDDFDVGEE